MSGSLGLVGAEDVGRLYCLHVFTLAIICTFDLTMTQHSSIYVHAIREKHQVIDTLGIYTLPITDDTCKALEIDCQVGDAYSSAFKSRTWDMINYVA
jgi:hypothetical protein